MSAAAQTKIFGIRLGVDPKLLVGALLVLAAILFWFNSRDTGETGPSVTATRTQAAPVPAADSPSRTRATRRSSRIATERTGLRLRPVDATRGDIDPTLRLDLLERLKTVQLGTPGRSLFEIGPSPQQIAAIKAANAHIQPTPVANTPPPAVAAQPVTAMVNIPLKYYGFARPATQGQSNKGMFLSEGDNVVVASEGETVEHRYLVVELTPTSARMEDTQMKQGQTLPVMPEAPPPQ